MQYGKCIYAIISKKRTKIKCFLRYSRKFSLVRCIFLRGEAEKRLCHEGISYVNMPSAAFQKGLCSFSDMTV